MPNPIDDMKTGEAAVRAAGAATVQDGVALGRETVDQAEAALKQRTDAGEGWIRRHKVLVAGGAIALLWIFVALIIFR